MGALAVDRSIAISADPQEVYDFVAIPGWYINDGQYVEHRIEETGDGVLVHDPTHGEFSISTVRLDPPRYAAFRWHSRTGDATTLVEFFIEPREEGSILKVRESGFESLSDDEIEVRKAFDDNVTGWELELGVAKTHLETPAN